MSELRKAGEETRLFNRTNDYFKTACCHYLGNGYGYLADGYKMAADNMTSILLEKNLDASNRDGHPLAFPIMFLYRHYLELRFKEIIKRGANLIASNASYADNHNLDALWSAVKLITRKIWSDTHDPEEFMLVDQLVTEFCEIDLRSQTFRYPENRDGLTPLLNYEVIDIKKVFESLEGISRFLEGVSAGIDNYLSNRGSEGI